LSTSFPAEESSSFPAEESSTTSATVDETSIAHTTYTPSNTQCSCPCTTIGRLSYATITKEELIEIAVKDLDINKKQTSAYVNSKSSAKDKRLSSKSMGVVGIILIVLPLILIVLVDIGIFCKCKH
jgi:hypothetical protein